MGYRGGLDIIRLAAQLRPSDPEVKKWLTGTVALSRALHTDELFVAQSGRAIGPVRIEANTGKTATLDDELTMLSPEERAFGPPRKGSLLFRHETF
jgi:hypothetical protein